MKGTSTEEWVSVVFARGGVNATRLDGVLKITAERVELYDLRPESGGLQQCSCRWTPTEHFRFRQLQAWVDLTNGFRVMFCPDEPLLHPAVRTSRRRRPLLHPAVDRSRSPRRTMAIAASSASAAPTVLDSETRSSAAPTLLDSETRGPASVMYSPTEPARSSANSWLRQEHPQHPAQLAQFTAASSILLRGGLIANPGHPNAASVAAALHVSGTHPRASIARPPASSVPDDPSSVRASTARPPARVPASSGIVSSWLQTTLKFFHRNKRQAWAFGLGEDVLCEESALRGAELRIQKEQAFAVLEGRAPIRLDRGTPIEYCLHEDRASRAWQWRVLEQ